MNETAMPIEPTSAQFATEHFFRHESARLVATLAGQFGAQRLQWVEDVVQEALVRALQTWPYRGVPDNPAAWLTQTARHLALDQLRREQRWNEREEGISAEQARWMAVPVETADGDDVHLRDDTLRLMFVCCHPQLSAEAQIALALRTLCGLSPAEIAAAFVTSEAAISKRLVRARQRIRELALPFELPEAHELPQRLDAVLASLYLLFNEGYKASSGEHLVRSDLCHEAIRLTELLATHPATGQPQCHALLALMRLSASRLPARTDDAGGILRLHEQDRSLWDQSLIHRGIQHLQLSARGDTLTEYHLEAGIAACHSTAANHAATDWARILTLYDQLVQLTPSPVVALNRAIAVGRVHGAQRGLEALAAVQGLDGYLSLHAALGTFADELGRPQAAAAHYRRALALAALPSERRFFERQIAACEAAEPVHAIK
ncbi:MAG: sigma-70 family RNA polymerase sigma factor [Prosthecobacter sp.]|uniref:RNA polymerase sigma factor n=1 Tax=Prosthecobacter sp. TaxID=1965333 RepID=UPI0025DDB847|nr:sigma-70 family RNA polymerase sigma factor [Prosthecobacter sp.]MCF7786569.1 sigma-70 family RNA polymerase sigma factor [Prosthecobacter sp.]